MGLAIYPWRRMPIRPWRCALLVAVLAFAPGAPSAAQEVDTMAATGTSRFKDPQDGWFDVSTLLASPRGFLIVPMPITEPAVGYGVAGGPVFLSPRRDEGIEGWARPDITALFGVWTENGTWGVAGGHLGTWAGGRLQGAGGGAYASVNLEFYGLNPVDEDAATEFNLEVRAGGARGRWRLGPKSPWWVGASFMYGRVTTSLEDAATPALEELESTITIAGPTLAALYDSRNNLFTPSRGLYLEATGSFFDDTFGSSDDFRLLEGIAIGYAPLPGRLYGGARLEVETSSDDTPFYRRPFVVLRGIPAMRYQGTTTTSLELEARWQFHRRFSAVGFGGLGVTTEVEGTGTGGDTVGSGGLGVRYLLARAFGLHYGIDVARGPEEWALYFQFGSAWLRP